MITTTLAKAAAYLDKLCVEITSRRIGSPGNRAATTFFADVVASFGFETMSPEFACMDWRQDGVRLTQGDASFEAHASPYSLGCEVRAPLVVATTVHELESVDDSRVILLLRGDIAGEQLMPKAFPFFNPEEHKHIIRLLESLAPRAIIAATSCDVEMVGGLYPFPLIEDGDFDIPSVFMTAEEGARLARRAGQEVELQSRAERIPARGCNVIARLHAGARRRVVFLAHIDARIGSPGAGDNASGVIVLLLLAELLAGYRGQLGIELVAMNGEDYYSNPGEQQFLAMNADHFDDIALGVNLDDVGYYRGRVAYSLYGCPADIAGAIHRGFSAYPQLMEGQPWYQGDHGLFIMHQTPSLAITSELLGELMAEITHTPKDRPETVDAGRLVQLALALRDLLLRLDPQLA